MCPGATQVVVDGGSDGGDALSSGVSRVADGVRRARGAVCVLGERLCASEERCRTAEDDCERLRAELCHMEAERATLAQSLEGARASERALRLQLRGVLEELSSAEHAVRVVEHALCHVPASMQHRTSVGDNAAAVPLLPARIEQLADYVCKARGGVSARLEELLPVALWHACDDSALARMQELRCAKEAAEAELRAALAAAEGQLCVVTLCEVMIEDGLAAAVLEARGAELLAALRADVGEACGVPMGRVLDAAFSDCGSRAVLALRIRAMCPGTLLQQGRARAHWTACGVCLDAASLVSLPAQQRRIWRRRPWVPANVWRPHWLSARPPRMQLFPVCRCSHRDALR
ncbi:hypothetical protein ERJ75_000005600 [Trypanosoma vivax]|nr:hypothetical protein ERJ75_000005600 [Trypanosoma vivax]